MKNIKKEDIELLSNKEITYLLLENSKKGITTADLFKKIIELKELPESEFESKVGDYYMALSTDKKFVMLEDGKWDLRNRHTSDKVAKVSDEEDNDEEEEIDEIEKEDEEEIDEDSYEDTDDNEDYVDAGEDLKDLVVIDEDELELEE